jgi:MBG domain (YGX type)/Bacterial Ig-like domain (group 3)
VSGKTQLTVIKADTTTSVASSANPSTYGEAVTFTATVSVNAPGAGTPTGMVNLYDGGACDVGTPLASKLTLTSGSATFTTSSLSATGSPDDIIACYSGDANFNATGTSSSTATTLSQIVNPAVLTVTANPQTKVYGQTDPTLAYTATGFQLTDTAATVLTGALTRAPGETVVGSPYAISQGTLAANSNYTIHFTGSTLTITPALASVTPNAASKTYGTADPVFTGTLSGLLAADNVTATYTRTAGETVGGSPYTISATLAPVGVLSNYSITYNTASFTITQASTTTTAASSLSPSNWGNVVILTATVSDSSPNSTGAPTGVVSFYNVPSGITCSSLGMIAAFDIEPLSSTAPYMASTSTPNLPVGTDTILACHNGDTNFFATSTGNGTATPFSQTVIAAPIATLTPPSLSFGNQQGGTTSSAQLATLCNGPSGPSNSPCYNAPVATAALSISSINFGGTNSTYFTQTNNWQWGAAVYSTFAASNTGLTVNLIGQLRPRRNAGELQIQSYL